MNQDSKFPIIQKSTITGENGITTVKSIVENNLNWLFRQIHLENDFGIDAYIDVITDSRQVTGKSIAIQVKTGKSFFQETNEIGFVFRGEIKHLNYYMNLQSPILIVIVDDVNKIAYWEVFTLSKISQAGANWKLTIPKKNVLSTELKSKLVEYVGPITDYASQFEQQSKFDKFLNTGKNRIILRVPKSDVNNLNIEPVLDAIERFQQSSELILNLKSSIDISFDDYEDDSREIFEIEEVCNYADKLYKSHNCWPYLLAMDNASAFMKFLFFIYVPFKKTEIKEPRKYKIEFESIEAWPFIEGLFGNLNSYCDEKGLSIETNKEITKKIVSHLITEK